MNAAIPVYIRIPFRTLTACSLVVLGLLVLFPPVAAHAAEEKVFGDVKVGPAGTPGSVSTATGDIEVRGAVGGDVKSTTGDVEVYAPVGGTVDAEFGDVIVGAPIGGDLDVGSGEVEWRPGGRVGGDFNCPNCTMDDISNAQVRGEMRFSTNPGFGDSSGGSGVLGLVGWFFATLVFVAGSVLAAVLLPRTIESSAQKIDESLGRSFLVGLASLPAALLLAVVLGVSIIGLPLLLLAAPAYLALVFFGALVAAYFIGRRILFAARSYHGGNALAAAIGASILAILYLIPFLGGLILSALALLGTGGAILALLSQRRGRPTYSSYEAYVSDRST